MSVKAVLFDLDGTLLPADQEVFTESYFRALTAKFAPLGYDPQLLVAAVWEGTRKMVAGDGTRLNEEVFWESFYSRFGKKAAADKEKFDEFYRVDFDGVRSSCGFTPRAAQTISKVKAKGLSPILASNPIFPMTAQKKRMEWAGVDPNDFVYITSFENMHSCKPNLAYYEEIIKTLGLTPSECAMVGNDVGEDMVSAELGFKTFLLTDCLINKRGKDYSAIPRGGFDELDEFIARL